MRLRQVALVARQLGPVVEDIGGVFGLGAPFHDPGVAEFGLENAVFPIGDTFLEVVSPKREGTTAGRLLERRGGDGGYMVILQVEDLEQERERLARLSPPVRVVWEISLGDAATMHLHPKDVGGAIVSLDWMQPDESWKWAGPDWRERCRRDVVTAIQGVEIQSADPQATSARWAAVLGRRAEPTGDVWRIALEAGEIRFVRATDGRGDGVSGVDLRSADADRALRAARERGLAVSTDTIELCGARFRLT